MEGKLGGKQGSARHAAAGGNRDLWIAVRNGSVRDVEAALLVLKKSGGNIDARDKFGSTALHTATWRNHVPIVKRLLDAGADPDGRDGESSWGCLHRALHFGHLAVAGALIEGGASMNLEDATGRIPADLVCGPLKAAIASPDKQGAGATEVLSWGNGSNYQLGTGIVGIQKVPCRVEALQGLDVIAVSAAKFHSVAVTSRGDIYAWGYGRGGRLGLEDYSGEVAVITPRQVTSGLAGRRIKTVAAAKHHTLVATDGGEVFSWGTNREGQLGYPSVDTQSTPRKVSTLKAKVVAVSAANKHSAAITECGEAFTWGSNKEGQLGYGTSTSAANCVPRCVEYLRGRKCVAVSTAKYHTIVLIEGEAFTWGHKMVTPRRVPIVRSTKKFGAAPLKFHQSEPFRLISIAAGVINSTAVSEEGLVFTWLSADPSLHASQVFSMTGHQVVSVSAGKFRTAMATVEGDVFAWDGGSSSPSAPLPSRIHGIKHALHLAVAETHSVVISGIYVPSFSRRPEAISASTIADPYDEDQNSDDDDSWARVDYSKAPDTLRNTEVPSLRDLCQKAIAETVVEPKNALQLLDIAESLGADELRRYCEAFILHNLGYILTISPAILGGTRPSVLADLERAWDAASSEPWSRHQLPVASATLPAVVDSEEDENGSASTPRTRKGQGTSPRPVRSLASFLQTVNSGDEQRTKQLRAIRKKLQQIEALEMKLNKGQALDEQQMEKVGTKPMLLAVLTGLDPEAVQAEMLASNPLKDRRQKRKRRKACSQDRVQVASVEEKPKETNAVECEKQKETIAEKTLQPAAPLAAVDVPALSAPTQAKSKAAKSRKGGLSLFLSGALEKTAEEKPQPVAPVTPVISRAEGPAWGGASKEKGSPSLRDIQKEQKASSVVKPRERNFHKEVHPTTQGILLSDFVRPSTPIPVVRPAKVAAAPAWVGSTSPSSVPSLRDIQMQQVKQKEQQRPLGTRSSPQAASPLVSMATTPPEASASSAWFKPDSNSPSSIRCIQIEEKAMKDLRRLYKNVRIVNH